MCPLNYYIMCWMLMFSAALTHLLFPSQEVKDLCFVCFQNLCVHAMLSCCVLRCAFFLLIFQRGLENDICLQRITRKPTHGQRPPLLLYQPHIWWRKDPKWKIPSTLVSGGLTHLVNYFQVVLELWGKKLLVETKSFPQIMLGGSPEQQEKVHTQWSVTNLMALNLIWKHSKWK